MRPNAHEEKEKEIAAVEQKISWWRKNFYMLIYAAIHDDLLLNNVLLLYGFAHFYVPMKKLGSA